MTSLRGARRWRHDAAPPRPAPAVTARGRPRAASESFRAPGAPPISGTPQRPRTRRSAPGRLTAPLRAVRLPEPPQDPSDLQDPPRRPGVPSSPRCLRALTPPGPLKALRSLGPLKSTGTLQTPTTSQSPRTCGTPWGTLDSSGP